MTDIMDLHTHSIASGHAYNTIYEMAQEAGERGLALLGVTEHGPGMPGTTRKNYFNHFRFLPRQKYGVYLMFGCELNILDENGTVDLEEKVLDRLDYTVASLHKICFPGGTAAQNTKAYLEVMKNPAVRIIGHPDDAAFPVDYETLVCAAKEHHVLLELNANSLHPMCVRKGARENDVTMLEYCRKYGADIVINSDAHSAADVGNHRRARALLEELQFPEELVVNRSLEAAAGYLPFLKRILAGELTDREAAAAGCGTDEGG